MASRAVERRKNGRKPLFIIMILHCWKLCEKLLINNLQVISYVNQGWQKKFVKWQQSVNNGFCTHMWLQNPLFTLYHLTKIFWKKNCQMATKFEQWVLYSHVTTKPIVQTLLPFDKFFCKNKKMSSSIYIRAFQFWTHISILLQCQSCDSEMTT